MTNKPTLGGYLELLFKVFVTMTVLIFWGVLIAVVTMAVPFILSLVCVLALVGAGFFVFSWNYVWVGTIALLILLGMTLK
jgi:hypothetical protein